jgi:NADH-quinone oxidoreductase subunit J
MGSIVLLFARQVMHAVYMLVVVLLGIALFYFLLGAEFLGVVQILIYAGGILVLMIYAVMLSPRINSNSPPKTAFSLTLAIPVVSLGIFLLFFHIIRSTEFEKIEWIKGRVTDSQLVSTSRLGTLLMVDYAVLFELAAIILLVAFIGAAAIIGKKAQSLP